MKRELIKRRVAIYKMNEHKKHTDRDCLYMTCERCNAEAWGRVQSFSSAKISSIALIDWMKAMARGFNQPYLMNVTSSLISETIPAKEDSIMDYIDDEVIKQTAINLGVPEYMLRPKRLTKFEQK